jgi:hypothetical protein
MSSQAFLKPVPKFANRRATFSTPASQYFVSFGSPTVAEHRSSAENPVSFSTSPPRSKATRFVVSTLIVRVPQITGTFTLSSAATPTPALTSFTTLNVFNGVTTSSAKAPVVLHSSPLLFLTLKKCDEYSPAAGPVIFASNFTPVPLRLPAAFCSSVVAVKFSPFIVAFASPGKLTTSVAANADAANEHPTMSTANTVTLKTLRCFITHILFRRVDAGSRSIRRQSLPPSESARVIRWCTATIPACRVDCQAIRTNVSRLLEHKDRQPISSHLARGGATTSACRQPWLPARPLHGGL